MTNIYQIIIGLVPLALIGVSTIMYWAVKLSALTQKKKQIKHIEATIITCVFAAEFDQRSIGDLRAGLSDKLNKQLLTTTRVRAQRRVDRGE